VNILAEAALEYTRLGLAVIPVKVDKRPVGAWMDFQSRCQSESEIQHVFGKNPHGLAVVAGRGSGGLEVIDVDQKYSLDGQLAADFLNAIEEHVPGVLEKLVQVRTVSGGLHLYYRSPKVSGNQKLAQRPATVAERRNKAHENTKVLIETRGMGGYAVTAPPPGYSIVNGDFSTLPLIRS